MEIKNKKVAFLIAIILISILLVWFAVRSPDNDDDLKKETITLNNSNGEAIEVKVEIADEEDERTEGLMHRESLCEDCGMLFVYEESEHRSFWMKNTHIPLSIAFISENGTIMEIQQMEPETTESHVSEDPCRYALEVNQGFFQENHIKAGDTVSIPERFQDG